MATDSLVRKLRKHDICPCAQNSSFTVAPCAFAICLKASALFGESLALRCDIVTIVEAPDEISATALNLSISAPGNVGNESLRAFSAAEMMTIVDKMT
jgi:GYD domain